MYDPLNGLVGRFGTVRVGGGIAVYSIRPNRPSCGAGLKMYISVHESQGGRRYGVLGSVYVFPIMLLCGMACDHHGLVPHDESGIVRLVVGAGSSRDFDPCNLVLPSTG